MFNTLGDGDPLSVYVTDQWVVDQFLGTKLWTWGRNSYGHLGDGTTVNKSSPVQTVAGGTNWKQVACGTNFTAAVKNDGSLWFCGYNWFGQLGDNTRTHKSSPVQTIAGGNNWKSVACGYAHNATLKTDGSLWVWGLNTKGQLGDGTTTHKSSPVQTIAGGTNWAQVACGYDHTAAIKNDGSLWLCGYNRQGQLGDNTRVDKSSPIQTVAGGNNWAQVACGNWFTAAIKTDGTLWTWGYNASGQLGDGTVVAKSSPIQTVAGGNNWKSVACGTYSTAAIKNDGTLWLWGCNPYGQLGDNTVVYKSSPIQTVAGGTNWRSVASGINHTAAVKIDGTLWIWGLDNYGQLGDGTVVAKSSPIQTVAGGTNWKSVAAGFYHTAALTL